MEKTPAGVCPGCGGLLFSNVFHICAANANMYPDLNPEVKERMIRESFVPPPPTPATSGVWSDPPNVVHNEDAGGAQRSKCGACGEPVAAGVFHKCAGNARFHSPKSEGGYLEERT